MRFAVLALAVLCSGRAFARETEEHRTERLAWSAYICAYGAFHNHAKRLIDEEYKYAREGGGIIDMRKIYEWQTIMRVADQHAEKGWKVLDRLHTQTVKCFSHPVIEIIYCMDPYVRDGEGAFHFTPPPCDYPATVQRYLDILGFTK